METNNIEQQRVVKKVPAKRGRKSKKDTTKDSLLILSKLAKNGNKKAIELLEYYSYVLTIKQTSEEQIIEFITKIK